MKHRKRISRSIDIFIRAHLNAHDLLFSNVESIIFAMRSLHQKFEYGVVYRICYVYFHRISYVIPYHFVLLDKYTKSWHTVK